MPSPTLPPYSLDRPHFPFPALAAEAGRARLGGEREVALACLMAARLAVAALAVSELPAAVRTQRAQAAHGWFASLALPAALHTPIDRVIAASARGATPELSAARGRDGVPELAPALRALVNAAARYIDGASKRELEHLIRSLKE